MVWYCYWGYCNTVDASCHPFFQKQKPYVKEAYEGVESILPKPAVNSRSEVNRLTTSDIENLGPVLWYDSHQPVQDHAGICYRTHFDSPTHHWVVVVYASLENMISGILSQHSAVVEYFLGHIYIYICLELLSTLLFFLLNQEFDSASMNICLPVWRMIPNVTLRIHGEYLW